MKVLEYLGEPLLYGGQEAFIGQMWQNFHDPDLHVTLGTAFTAINQNLFALAEQRGETIIHYDFPTSGKNWKNKPAEMLKKLLTEQTFDVVHIHSGSLHHCYNCAKVAKTMGVPKVIVHTHLAGAKKTWRHTLGRILTGPKFTHYGDVFLACSHAAANWQFPRRVVRRQQYRVIANGIDVEKFRFQPAVREKVRQELGLGDTLTIMQVGRLEGQKNPLFLVPLAQALKVRGQDFKIVVVGEGGLRTELENLIQVAGLTDQFILTGARQDVSPLLMAADIFVFPSQYEGLGIAAVEAQASGLPCLCANTVPREVAVTNRCQFLPLGDPAPWAETIIAVKDNLPTDRVGAADQVAAAGYRAADSAALLEQIYREDG